MSVRQKEQESTPIFAELSAEFDLDQLLGELTEPDNGAQRDD
ncbi:hypothetical protein [Amycolatopsis pithecellobii]|nr:hypothetical protein [Amycolatopsis pithecellobii]